MVFVKKYRTENNVFLVGSVFKFLDVRQHSNPNNTCNTMINSNQEHVSSGCHTHNMHWCCTPFVCLCSYDAGNIWEMHFLTEKQISRHTAYTVRTHAWTESDTLSERAHFLARISECYINWAPRDCDSLHAKICYAVYIISIFPAIPELRRFACDAWMCVKESRMCAQKSRALGHVALIRRLMCV